MQICEESGIDVTRKAIWRDRRRIFQAPLDGELRKWLEGDAARIGKKGSASSAKLPTYSQVIASFGTRGFVPGWTVGDIEGVTGDKLMLRLSSADVQISPEVTSGGGVKTVTKRVDEGALLTVRKKLVFQGQTYEPGDRVTIDPQGRLIKVSSWD